MKKPFHPWHRLLLHIMRLTFYQLLLISICSVVAVASHSPAQELLNRDVTLDLKNVTLNEALTRLEQGTKVKFAYSSGLVNLQKTVSIDARQEKLFAVLDRLLLPLDINYRVRNNQILLSRAPKKTSEIPAAISTENLATVADRTVKGTVTSPETNEPLPGVSIILKGTQRGTTTDVSGKFQLEVPDDNATLIFSFVGYLSQEVILGNRTDLAVALQLDTKALDEIVVVGYGTQKKSTLTGSIAAVKGSEIAENPVPNVSGSIAGRVAGVSMRPNGGQPGSDSPEIHIRGIGTTGNNKPLVVVDGVIRDNINQIDPSSIETVTVLKDAAAVAPYGLGGANGVLLITTKKGATGAPTLSFGAYYGSQSPTYYPKMLSAQDYMRLKNEAYLNENPTGTQLPFATDLVENYANLNREDPDKYPISNTKDLVNMNAPMQNYTLQLSGGSERIKYQTGFGFLKQNGMFDPVKYMRYSYNMNLTAEATKTTTVSLSLIGSVERVSSVDTAVSAGNLFRNGFKYIPIRSLYYSNGLWGEFAGNSPVGVLNAGYTKNSNNTLLTTIAIEQKLPFIKGLSVKGTFSYDPVQRTKKGYHKPFYYYTQDLTTTPYTYKREISTAEGGAAAFSWLAQQFIKTQTFTYQGYLNYHSTFGKHDFTGLIVAEARNNTYELFSARRNNFAVDVDELNMGSSNKNDFDNGGTSSTGSQIGYVYRVGYAYAGKYLLEASGRYDGHYYFAPGKRWGYFPAFSAGWVISEENFLKNGFNWIDNLKVRGSWGKSGNLAGTAFQYLTGYNLNGNAYAFGPGSMVQGAVVPNEANKNITWEISTKTDIGLEASLWRGLLTIEADYFHEKRTGMLLPPAVSVPVEYGLALADENGGIMENNGVELSLGTNYRFQNDLRLGINGNVSYAKNKMIKVFETAATRNNPNRSRTGRALGTQFGYKTDGLFTTDDDKNDDGLIDAADGYNVTQFGALRPGDIRYVDVSGPQGVPDGKIDSNDEVVIGKPVYPLLTYGLNATADWKGFDLSLFFQGSSLASLDIRQFQTIPFNNNNSNSSYEYYDNRWTPQTQGARYPRATQAPYANNTQLSDFWMTSTAHLRLKNAIIGYTLPKSLTRAIGIQHVRVYASGQNLLTFSKLKFMDPEVGYTDRETAYPNQRVYVFGLNVTF
ncbi:TonB-dependent receptor [Dyadobacter jiangsuensis]